MSTPTAARSARAPAAASSAADDREEERRWARTRLRRRSLGLRRRRAVVRAALRDHDREPAEQQQRPGEPAVRPEVRLRDQRDERDPDERDADEEPRPLAVAAEGLGDDRVAATFVGDHERGGDVEQDPCSADERQDHEADPEERRRDVEVPAEPPRDAGDEPVVAAPVELFDGCLGLGGAHGVPFVWVLLEDACRRCGCTIGKAPEPTLIFARVGGRGNPGYNELTYGGDLVSTWSVLRQSCKPRSRRPRKTPGTKSKCERQQRTSSRCLISS